MAAPADWEVAPGSGRLVDHRDPDSSTYLRFDLTPDPHPDLYANRQELSAALAQRLDGYEELQLAEVTVRDEPAALLQYTYTDGGADRRACNLNFLAEGRAYALKLQSQAEDWDEVEPMFAAILGGFEPR